MADLQTVIVEKENGICLVTLNRPERFNAVNEQMTQEISGLLGGLNEDKSIRALIITGAGKAFSSGGDFKKDSALDWASETSSGETFMSGYREIVPRIMGGLQSLNVPTIAAINGPAVGLGCDMSLACDVRIACENTRLSPIWIKRGLIPAAGGFWMLPRIIGLGRAAELIFSGRFIEAEEGERIGLFNKVVPATSLRAEAIALAQTFTENPPIGLKFAKMMLYRGLSIDYRTGIELAGAVQAIAHTTEDHTEAMNAWREKRKGVYKGK